MYTLLVWSKMFHLLNFHIIQNKVACIVNFHTTITTFIHPSQKFLQLLLYFERELLKNLACLPDIIWRIAYSVLYNATKTLAFSSYFCKMRVKIPYWQPAGELIFPENFHSLTYIFFQFKFWLWLSDLLNRTIDSDIKVLNHILLTLASDSVGQIVGNYWPVK